MCFKAIDHIPNHAMRWMGGQSDGHSSDHGPHIGEAIAATAYAGKQIGQSVGSMGQGLKKHLQQKEANKAAEIHRKAQADQVARQTTALERLAGGSRPQVDDSKTET
jgi:hypothetical protein